MPISKTKFSYTLDLSEQLDKNKIKPSKRKALTKVVGDFIIDSIVGFTSNSTSPVKGGAYKKALSPEYAEKVGKKLSDLYEEGDMLGSMRVESFKDKVTIRIVDPDQKKKANNHNTVQDSVNKLPQRKFMPNDDVDGEVFKAEITNAISRIIKDASKD